MIDINFADIIVHDDMCAVVRINAFEAEAEIRRKRRHDMFRDIGAVECVFTQLRPQMQQAFGMAQNIGIALCGGIVFIKQTERRTGW